MEFSGPLSCYIVLNKLFTSPRLFFPSVNGVNNSAIQISDFNEIMDIKPLMECLAHSSACFVDSKIMLKDTEIVFANNLFHTGSLRNYNLI